MSTGKRKPVDLARARAAEERIAARLEANPALRERTAAMLAGDLATPDLEEPMTGTLRNTNIRLPETEIERAEALLPQVAKSDLGAAGKVTRSDVLRLAVRRGLDQLEAEYAGDPALPGMGE